MAAAAQNKRVARMSSRESASREAAAERRRPQLEVVEHSQRFLGVLGTVAGLTIIVAMIGMVGFHAVIVQGQAGLNDVQAELSEAADQNQRLRIAVAELESPERIVAEAQSRLGMVEPPTLTYVTPRAPLAAYDPPALRPNQEQSE